MIPAEDVLVLALLEARAIATFLLIVLHNLIAALATAREIEIVTAMCATETEIEEATKESDGVTDTKIGTGAGNATRNARRTKDAIEELLLVRRSRLWASSRLAHHPVPETQPSTLRMSPHNPLRKHQARMASSRRAWMSTQRS